MLKQITREEWFSVATERFYCFPLCGLPLLASEIESRYNISFFEYEEDGLGTLYGSFIAIEDKMFFLISIASKDDMIDGVTVEIKSFEENKGDYIDLICLALCIDRCSLLWENEHLQEI